jgi:hypothetical protein
MEFGNGLKKGFVEIRGTKINAGGFSEKKT